MNKPSLARIAGPRPRRRAGAVLTLSIALAVVIAIVLANDSSGPSSANASAGITGATTVQRRNLVETDTESGTVSYVGAHIVYNRLGGTLTWLPSVGQVIKPGGTLFKVANAPVVLMDGTTPAYRELDPSDSDGPDIRELNRNLVALGFNPDSIVVDDVWQPATTAGVEAFQESLGETATGSLSLGQVVFLPGAQLISTVDGTIGSNGGGGSSNADLVDPPSHPEFVSITKTTTNPAPSSPQTGGHGHRSKPKRKTSKSKSKSKGTSNQTLAALVALLQAEIRELGHEHSSPSAASHPSSSKPSSSDPHPSSDAGSPGGGGGGSPVELLQTTSTQLIVTVDLNATLQSEAVVGEHVTVELPDGDTVDGKITSVSPVAQSSSSNNNGPGGGSSTPTIPVTVKLTGHVNPAGLDQATVSVNFARARANNVLAVPVTALLAVSGGNYAVQEAAPPHKLIPVTTGMFASGEVEVSGAGLYPGLEVTDSQG